MRQQGCLRPRLARNEFKICFLSLLRCGFSDHIFVNFSKISLLWGCGHHTVRASSKKEKNTPLRKQPRRRASGFVIAGKKEYIFLLPAGFHRFVMEIMILIDFSWKSWIGDEFLSKSWISNEVFMEIMDFCWIVYENYGFLMDLCWKSLIFYGFLLEIMDFWWSFHENHKFFIKIMDCS